MSENTKFILQLSRELLDKAKTEAWKDRKSLAELIRDLLKDKIRGENEL